MHAEIVDNFRTVNIKERANHWITYNDQEFIQRYRISKAIGEELLARMEGIEPAQNRSGYNLSGQQKLLITLRYLATGNFQRVDGDLCGVSQATVSRVVNETVRKIAKMSPQYIVFPTEGELVFQQARFMQLHRFPSVVGVLDCTHVPIKNPGGENGELFRNRKGFFSFNVQAVSNAEGHFTNIVCRWPGSTHDSTIFNNSRLCSQMENGNIRGVLLGDNGYPCRPYLLTPFPSIQLLQVSDATIGHTYLRGVSLKECLANGNSAFDVCKFQFD